MTRKEVYASLYEAVELTNRIKIKALSSADPLFLTDQEHLLVHEAGESLKQAQREMEKLPITD